MYQSFTPNGDGYNDTWSIHFSEHEPQLSVKIFDRYGKLITKPNLERVLTMGNCYLLLIIGL
jgi:gliding motility-associated-like protein